MCDSAYRKILFVIHSFTKNSFVIKNIYPQINSAKKINLTSISKISNICIITVPIPIFFSSSKLIIPLGTGLYERYFESSSKSLNSSNILN